MNFNFNYKSYIYQGTICLKKPDHFIQRVAIRNEKLFVCKIDEDLGRDFDQLFRKKIARRKMKRQLAIWVQYQGS